MALTVTHAKTNNIADWTQAQLDAQIALGNFPAGTQLADIVLPTDWNDDHTVIGNVVPSDIVYSPIYVSGSFNITSANSTYIVDTSAIAATGQLPAASSGTSRYTVTITSNAHTATILPNGTDKINVIYTDAVMRGANTAATFELDGINNINVVGAG